MVSNVVPSPAEQRLKRALDSLEIYVTLLLLDCDEHDPVETSKTVSCLMQAADELMKAAVSVEDSRRLTK